MAAPIPKKSIFRRGWRHHPHLQMVAFLGAGDGMARTYKWSNDKKFHKFFYMISDKIKIYIKIVENDEI